MAVVLVCVFVVIIVVIVTFVVITVDVTDSAALWINDVSNLSKVVLRLKKK